MRLLLQPSKKHMALDLRINSHFSLTLRTLPNRIAKWLFNELVMKRIAAIPVYILLGILLKTDIYKHHTEIDWSFLWAWISWQTIAVLVVTIPIEAWIKRWLTRRLQTGKGGGSNGR